MSLTSLFGWNFNSDSGTELPNIFPLSVIERDFVAIDTTNTFAKILTDVVERTHGISEQYRPALWDNCLQSEAKEGLITRLAKGMAEKRDLFLIFDPALGVIVEATATEQQKIKDDYAKSGESSLGIYVSFKNFMRTDMLKLYSTLEYCTVASLSKSMNISKAVQIKMADLRKSVSLTDSSEVKIQAKVIATALANGKDVLLDGGDKIETSSPDLKSVDAAMLFINQKKSFYLGLPASYITGEAPKGLGDSGEGDAKAVERGLKNYYFSIIKPVLESIFKIKTNFKSQDFRQITSALEALKTFALVGGDLVSRDNQTMIINKLLDLDEGSKGDEAAAPPDQNPNQPVRVV